jgi:4-amino-4-deoxy-L-arabinose transferase-like glycosyltransferase
VITKVQIQPAHLSHYDRRLLVFLVALTLVHGLLYAAVIPPWQSQDEEFHFAQARLLLPVAPGETAEDWQRELLDSLKRFRFYELGPSKIVLSDIPARFSKLERNTPPYWLYALADLPWIDHGVILQLYVMRLVSVLILVGTTVIVYLTARELFPNDTFIPIVASALLLFIPEHTHINTALNDGNLAEFATSLALYFLVRATVRGYSATHVILILASTGLALWAKQIAYFLAIVVAVAFAFVLLRRYGRNWRVWAGVLLGGTLAGWIIWQLESIRNILLSLQEIGRVLLNDPGTLDKFWIFWRGGYHSLWASPGWLVGTDYHWWDRPALVLIGIGLVGALWFGIRGGLHDESAFRRGLTLGWLGFSLLLAVLELILINAYLLTLPAVIQGIHGRYAYVAAMPFAIVCAVGWRQLVPSAWRQVTSLAFVALFFLFDCIILFTYYIPFFYPLW